MASDAGTGDPPSTKPGKRQKVHIRIEYPGGGDPELVLVRQCDTLVGMLGERDAGAVDRRRAGDGAVDIFIASRFPGHTREVAEKAVAKLGLAESATIKIVTGEANDNGR
jgi:hypothetical protein